MATGLFSLGSLTLLHMSGPSKSNSRMMSGKGVMAILSPAKTLNLRPYEGGLAATQPDCDRDKTLEIARAMKNCKSLKKLLSVSDNIAATAKGYWEDFSLDENPRAKDLQVKPCIYSFSGAAYQGLQIEECSDDVVMYLQENLRIIDPLYGALRPLDRMQPYRLEMATKNLFDKVKLADFWRDSVTSNLGKDLQRRETQILLNLASDEYSAAVDPEQLPGETSYVKVVFREEGRVVAVHAKRARGLMARYIAENNVQSLEEIKRFSDEGYKLDERECDDVTIVFDRKKGSNKKRSVPTKKSAARKKKS